MDFSYSTAELEFRDQVRSWMDETIPGDYGSDAWPVPEDPQEQMQEIKDWMLKVHEGGWSGINWPKEFGGRECSPIELFIYQDEMSKYITPPPMNTIGVGMAGPTIMAHGSDEQKNRHLENILSGKEIWCQGFSEPNAGSDLAGLKTSAVLDGDEYVVNGQKIWTSGAHHAQYCILLTRTDNTGSKHSGMTYFILDMSTPGIDIRPLVQITGDPEFNEVFFEDVRIPKENILGGQDNGWMVAIHTLMHERVNIAAILYGRIKRTLADVVELTRTIKKNGKPLCEDPVIRKKLAYFYTNVEQQRLNNLRMRANATAGGDPGPIGSIFKLVWGKANQDLLELAVDILGPYAELMPECEEDPTSRWMFQYLRARANSIEGGTSEILKNITGERVLGLPK
ncbi:MAG TPA: acyl-CoA dehydrogenase [Candidatus Hydrogenedentes bacterium]|nr:acyl-CoA dehydrogenase [Candidatus Hydrogenedentota bacterium]